MAIKKYAFLSLALLTSMSKAFLGEDSCFKFYAGGDLGLGIFSIQHSSTDFLEDDKTTNAVAGYCISNSNTVFKTSYNVVTTKDAYSATIAYNLNDGPVFYQSNLSGNITANFVGVKNTGSVVTKAEVIIEQGATPYIINAVQTDGTVRTIKWKNNTVPSGNSNGVDLMTFAIIKDANSTFTVLGSLDTHG